MPDSPPPVALYYKYVGTSFQFMADSADSTSFLYSLLLIGYSLELVIERYTEVNTGRQVYYWMLQAPANVNSAWQDSAGRGMGVGDQVAVPGKGLCCITALTDTSTVSVQQLGNGGSAYTGIVSTTCTLVNNARAH